MWYKLVCIVELSMTVFRFLVNSDLIYLVNILRAVNGY